jgi:hypothetical protein
VTGARTSAIGVRIAATPGVTEACAIAARTGGIDSKTGAIDGKIVETGGRTGATGVADLVGRP